MSHAEKWVKKRREREKGGMKDVNFTVVAKSTHDTHDMMTVTENGLNYRFVHFHLSLHKRFLRWPMSKGG